MKVGVFLPYEGSPGAFAPTAESAGFDYLAYGEHVLFRRPILNAFVALAAAAAVTSRIRLLSALTLLPLYPAALAAKLASSLDAVSEGRFELGVGVGGEVPEEFEACGVDVSRRGRLADDAVRQLRSFFTDARMQPNPAGPMRVWIGGRSERAVQRANELGDVWVPYLVTPEQVAAGAARLEGPSAAVVCFVGAGIDQARANAFVSAVYDVPAERVGRYVVAGPPGHVAARLREFREAGAEAVVLNLCAEGRDAVAMTELVGREVRPALAAD